MNRLALMVAMLAVAAFVTTGCSGSDGSPVMPTAGQELTTESNTTGQTQTHLWGYYDVYIDIENRAAVAVPNRQVMFAVNVVRFINDPPTNLTTQIQDVVYGSNYVDIDIDVTLTHPFPGMSQFSGYDVRGVFIGDGSSTADYNGDLRYAVKGTDQSMFNADGYTRWFNFTEFSTGGMPLFSYTQGAKATPDFDGTATLNPYRYFADGLGASEDVWDFLMTTGDHGVFSSGAVNTRNYYLRFPDSTDMEFGYAIVANWEGIQPEEHPSNAPEAVACKVTDNSDVHYPDSTGNSGDLILDISLFGWDYQPSIIHIESTVLSAVANFDPTSIATGGGEHYSTYHIEIPADNVQSPYGNEYWVIAEYEGFEYTNDFGVPNKAGSDPLAAIFRHDLTVEHTGNFGWARTWGGPYFWDVGRGVAADGSGNVYTTGDFEGTVDFDPNGGDPHTSNGYADVFLSKFDSSGNFEWARTWGGSSQELGFGVATDDSGNVYVTGNFIGAVDFDPNGGDLHTSNGCDDVFLSKFDSSGNFKWAQTWGGSDSDGGHGVAANGSGNVYIIGTFEGTVDFDPSNGDLHTSNGSNDAFLSKFDSSGNFKWAQTWGGSDWDGNIGVTVDGSGNVYATGYFGSTVNFDPSGGDPHTSNGYEDIYLSKFDSSGNFEWARTWGGSSQDCGYRVATDGSGDVYVTGYFRDTVDFDSSGGNQHTSNGLRDVYLSKFDSSGSFEWVRTWGGSHDDYGRGVAADGFGNVYITGKFEDTVDFNPGGGDPHTTNGSWDVFLSSFDSLGNFECARTWGGLSADVGRGVAIDGSGNVYVTGYFYGPVDFAPTDPPCNDDPDEHTSNGGYDAFLTKHLPNGCW